MSTLSQLNLKMHHFHVSFGFQSTISQWFHTQNWTISRVAQSENRPHVLVWTGKTSLACVHVYLGVTVCLQTEEYSTQWNRRLLHISLTSPLKCQRCSPTLKWHRYGDLTGSTVQLQAIWVLKQQLTVQLCGKSLLRISVKKVEVRMCKTKQCLIKLSGWRAEH